MDKQTKGTFEGQVALVTGGSTGIGAAIALELAQAGARVVITGRHEQTLRTSAARHPQIAYHVADAGQSGDAARAVDEVRTRFGQLDALVNNAGVFEIRALGDAASDHVRRLWDTNVLGVVEMTRAALPLLRQIARQRRQHRQHRRRPPDADRVRLQRDEGCRARVDAGLGQGAGRRRRPRERREPRADRDARSSTPRKPASPPR